MTGEQGAILVVLACTLAVFIWDRWRFDVVAVTSLMVCVLIGVVEPAAAFTGFSNPAVITVAAILVIGRTLAKSGAVDALAAKLARIVRSQQSHLLVLCALAVFLSAFMNNVGALALMMPIALSTARQFDYPPAIILMPLSFSTLLGGMTTLIGTPPNLLISGFRAQATGERFLMFDFAPTGLALSALGIAFIVLVGWRLLPRSQKARQDADRFDVTSYITEARVGGSSKLVGLSVSQLEARRPSIVIGIVRDDRRLFGRLRYETVKPGDVLLLQTDTATLQAMAQEDGLELVERAGSGPTGRNANLSLTEAIVAPNSLIQGSNPLSLDLRRRWGINLIAVSSQGRRFEGRLRDATLSTGDILLLEGEEERINQAVADLGCLPLANRRLVFEPKRFVLPIVLFALAIAVTALGILSAAVAFTCAVIAMTLTGVIRPAEIYESIDWSVIVLLGAMIPVGDALATTGAAQLIGSAILRLAGGGGPEVLLAVALVLTMAITPVLNNAATVVIMAPIVVSVAAQIGVRPEPFLIAVAIGASCDFLTPFGHHNNTIIMGAGNYRFGDFWRLGLPLDAIVIAVSLLTIPLVWPF